MLRFLKRLLGAVSGKPPPNESRDLPREGAERQQREAVEHFAELVAAVRDHAVFLLDPQGNVRTWNAGAERIKGYRAEEIIGRHFSCFYPREVISAGWPEHELAVAAETGRFEDEGWRLRKDGSKLWANVVITALRDEAGALRGFIKITRDMTSRKEAEEKLRMSEERFRLLVDGVQDYAIFLLDPEGRIASWNAGAERIKGYSATEIIGQHFSRFYPSEARERGVPQSFLVRAAEAGRVEDEGWRVRKDGSRFWASVVITALYDDNRKLRGFTKITRDLTERREAEENTRRLLQAEAARQAAEAATQEIDRQREQLHVTLNSIGDAVIVTDEGGHVTFANPVAAALTGWNAAEAVGQPLDHVFRIINEDSRQIVENPVDIVLRENRIVELANHTALVTKNGREIPIADSAAPIRNPDGSIVGVVLVFRDVTQTRQAIEDRLYLAAIVESSDDAIIGMTLDGAVASWNRGAERLYGYTAAEAIGNPVSLLIPPDYADDQEGITERVLRGEYIEHYETVRLRKDGSQVDVSLTVSPVRDSEGRVIGASKIARDITAQKEQERRTNEFLALLAHELRNPLAPLRSGLQILRLAGNDRQALEQARSVMERQLQHLVRLVDDLLDVSRISRGKLQLRKERITLASVVAHALDVCTEMVKKQEAELTVTLPEEAVYVDADKTRLTQAICNLLSNAAKYSDRGSQIWLTVERDGSEAVITVKDTGIGIPPNMLPRVFDMFTQVDRSLEKSQGGLGVGLTIVKRLVEMHGGNVEARSEGYGHGSEFIIRLPVALSVVHEPPSEEAHDVAPSPGIRRRVLVVDDNVDAATTLAMMLRMMGNEVRTAHDGLTGLEVAAEFRPDMIVLDIGMPRLNGYETARRIRQQPWGKGVTLVALTGWGQEEDRRKSEEAGFQYHLVKPLEPEQLEKLLASLQAGTG